MKRAVDNLEMAEVCKRHHDDDDDDDDLSQEPLHEKVLEQSSQTSQAVADTAVSELVAAQVVTGCVQHPTSLNRIGTAMQQVQDEWREDFSMLLELPWASRVQDNRRHPNESTCNIHTLIELATSLFAKFHPGSGIGGEPRPLENGWHAVNYTHSGNPCKIAHQNHSNRKRPFIMLHPASGEIRYCCENEECQRKGYLTLAPAIPRISTQLPLGENFSLNGVKDVLARAAQHSKPVEAAKLDVFQYMNRFFAFACAQQAAGFCAAAMGDF